MVHGDLRDGPICEPQVTDYDRVHALSYLRLLDADAARADWREAASLILGLDVAADPDAARRIHDHHLARARWMASAGYRGLLADASKG